MSLPTPVADRLGLLIPRLASEHDGEVVATARAIHRTLMASGRDCGWWIQRSGRDLDGGGHDGLWPALRQAESCS